MASRSQQFPTARHTGIDVRLALRVGRVTIEGTTVPAFLLHVLEYLDRRGLLDRLALPLLTSGDNYLLALSPRHPSGRPFGATLEYRRKSDGLAIFVNTNHPRFFALRQGARILEAVGLAVTLPTVGMTS